MPVGTTWNRTSPASSDNPANGAQEIADLKKMVDERARNGGHVWEPDGDASATNAGRHVCGMESQAGGTSAVANEFYIYADTAPSGTLKDFTFKDRSHASPGVDLQSTIPLSVTKVRKLQSTTDGVLVDAGGVTITAGGLTVTAGTVSLPANSIQATELSADSVETAKILDANVTRPKLGTRAATSNGFGHATTTTGAVSAETTVLTASLTTAATGSPGFVHCAYYLNSIVTGGGGANLTIRLKKDAVTIHTMTMVSVPASVPTIAMAFVDSGLVLGTTYSYTVTVAASVGSISITDRTLTVVEYKD